MRKLRFAFRGLMSAPLLSLVVVLSLGLGIGVNTAIFSLLYQVVLSALPVPHPEKLVLLTSPGDLKNGGTHSNLSGGRDYIFNWRTLRELEKHTAAAAVAGFRTFPSNLAFAQQTVNGMMTLVSGHYFQVLDLQPFAGRLIEPADDTAVNPVAALSYRYWHDRLGGDPNVLNKMIKVNGQAFTIVGVTPPAFTSTTVGEEPDVFLPISFKPRVVEAWNGTDRLDEYWVYLLARLKPGVTMQQAAADLNGPYRSIVDEIATTIRGRAEQSPRFRQQKLSLKEGSQGNSGFREQYRSALKILLLATALVLLIAIANAANLLLARSAERRKDLAIRAALGASRTELMGEFLREAMMLACAGGAAGLLIAAGTLRLLLAWWGDNAQAQVVSTGLQWPMLWFGVALSIATGLLVGLYPAWDAARASVAGVLSDESAKSSPSRGAVRLRRVLVCAQVIISIVLLVPTGLFLKSLVNLLHVDLGIRTANVVGFTISPQSNGYTPAQSQAIFDRAERELAAIPGARSAVGSSVPLLDNSTWGSSFSMEGALTGPHRPNSKYNEVGPDFFSKAGIPLIAGREIAETDTAASPKVVVVNEAFAREFFPGRSPMGHLIGFSKSGTLDTEIVGVVKDSHYASVRDPAPPLFYRPWRQDDKLGFITLYVRSDLPVSRIIPQIRTVMRSIDRDVPLENMRTLEDQVHYNIHGDELIMRLAAAFAALATVLAMLGLYGVMAHGVARRTREIGIRMALGARPARIRSMIMRELVWILGFGLGLGIPAALASTRLVESRLFGVQGRDPFVVAAASLLLALTAAAAAYWPARRASLVDPLEALRCE